MEWILYPVAFVFSILGAGCVGVVLLGLPGTWIMLGLAFLIEMVDQFYLPAGSAPTFNGWLLGSCLVLAILGEVLEFMAGLLGAKKAGSSRRGMIGALVGGLVGALLGTGIPVPVVGTLIGAVLGTFGGAVIGELSQDEEKRFRETLKPAMGATVGRILGTLSKVPIALAIWLALSVAAFWP